MTVIFPHIPKCGGTSIETQLKNLPINVFLDYVAPPTHGGHGKRKSDERNREFCDKDFSEYDLVFGHFPIDRYVSGRYRYVALCRDPFARVVSQVNFLMERYRRGVALNPKAKNCAMQIESGEMSILQYVIQTRMFGVYELYLCRWPKQRFTPIGDMTGYDAFLDRLSDLIGCELKKTEMRRKMDYVIEIPDETAAEIKSLLAEEYEWYRDFIRELTA